MKKSTTTTTTIEAIGQDEPDWLEFMHAGLKCLVRRHARMGHLCGYVRLPRGCAAYRAVHNARRLHRKDILAYNSPQRSRVYRKSPPFLALTYMFPGVHGGISFAGKLHEARGPMRGLWVGFDCAHYTDLVPEIEFLFKHRKLSELATEEIYRTIDYVEKQTRMLAEQVKAAA